MTTSIFPWYNVDLDAGRFLELFRQVVRSGVVEGSEVTAGSSGWNISINSGKVLADGSVIYDDLTKLNHTNLGHVAGNEGHYAVYETYAYAPTNPPPSPAYLVAAATPPLQPVVPGGGVKLADIFIPDTATSILSPGVRIVNAPKLFSRDDSGELIDRLVMSIGNTQTRTNGAVNYDDATGNITLTQDLVIEATCSSHRQQFEQAPPLVRGIIPAGTYAVPGTSPNRDVLVYTLFDRSIPNENLACTLKFLDRNAPDFGNVTEILLPSNHTKIKILGIVSGTRMSLVDLNGQMPPPDADARKFLRDSADGQHVWELVSDSKSVGGAKAGISNITARDAIASDLRKQGMICYVQSTGLFYVLEGGLTNSDWRVFNDSNFAIGGHHVVADEATLLAIPSKYLRTGMSAYQVDTSAVRRWKENISIGTPNNWDFEFYSRGDELGAKIGLDTIYPGNEFTSTTKVAKREIKALAFLGKNPDANACSRVIKGGELVPFEVGSVPMALLHPTVAITANSTDGAASFVRTTSAVQISLNTGVPASFIGGVVPSSYPSNVYCFLRSDGALRASTVAPDSRGRPSAADATYTTSDYCYVGMLRPKANIGTYQAVWGHFNVSHDGDGLRRIRFDYEEFRDPTDTFSGSSGAVVLSDSVEQTVDTGPATAPATFFPTACEVEEFHRLLIPAAGSGAVSATSFCSGAYMQGEASDQFAGQANAQVLSPVRTDRPRVMLRAVFSGGTRTAYYSVKYVGILENVNRPINLRQSTFLP